MAKEVPKRPKQSVKPAKSASRTEKHTHASKKAPKSPPAILNPERLFPIVGVGASAGGLEAFTALLKHLPSDTGMAFVLIQHLDRKQPSHLTDLLSKATRMPVLEVNASTPLKPDHVYVIGARVCLRMSEGILLAEERESGRILAIDYFLRSLAQSRSSKAIGVILSGTASDGTLGLRAVKAEGGVTFAQEPSSAKFDGMPRSAIATGVVDFVLTPEEIASRLVRLTRHPSYGAPQYGEDEEDAQKTDSALNRIFQLLRAATGNDFTHYKHTTIRRRIHRRMALRAIEKLSDYAVYLQDNQGEARALANDLLICVTAFFRDRETLEALDTKVFPEMVKNREPEDPIRVWVPGCATGEEAYSIAVCLTEFLERSGANVPMRIFATDISEIALEQARAGRYSMSALAEVSPERLKRFFVKFKDGYQIAQSIRANCVFAQQNVIRDPPFYNLDLISCCNLLIYFGPVLQRKALSTFHYALKPGGVLVLGPSESISQLSQSFWPMSKKLKLYSNQARPVSNIQFLAAGPQPTKVGVTAPAGGGARETLNVQKTAERILLAHYAPAGVIVDNALNVVHVRGDTGPYLQLASGEPTYSLLKMAREGLVVALRTALLKAKQGKGSVSEQARVRYNGQFKDINLRVTPVDDPSTPALHFMVVFEDVAPAAAPGSGREQQKWADNAKPTNPPSGENARLKQELTATKDYLQSIIEEQEASAEELKSANEEAQASNEELETAKEELQSTNEELNTVNDELKTRNAALTELNNDLSNVLTGINVPMVLVGRDLSIRRFTPSMGPMLNLRESDVGRSISDLKPNINLPDLPELLRGVINGAVLPPRELEGPNGGWFSLKTLPYKTGNGIDGALLVLLDVDVVRRGRDFAEAIIETTRQPLAVLSKDLKIRRVNRAFFESFKVRKEDTEDRSLWELGNGQWNIPKLLEALKKIVPEKGGFEDFEIEHDFESIGRRTMLLNARELRQETPFGGPAILLAIEDVTPRKQAEATLGKNQDQLRRMNEDLQHFAFAASHDLQEPLRMVMSYVQLLSRDYKGKLGPNADEYIRYAVEGAQRMEDLLKGMREYWQAGERGAEHHATVNSNDAIEKALLNLREAVSSSRAVVTHDPLPPVWAEEVMLVQVFQNLIGNAIKYRSKKPPRVHITAVKNGEEGCVFSVKDNGIGIDPQYAEKVFDMFTRLNGRKYPGSGIGLALCKKLVEQFGGRIWVSSGPGRGADFKFTIPCGE